MTAYYNEIEPYAAQWIRNLISAGHIAPGDVDERSIVDVRPDDLVVYTQCHFFAGIAGWSLAARLAGWPDDRPIWTGSCPCQPFSVAGNRGGFDDARHLWPEFFRLISACRPDVAMGEQVASKDGLAWLDTVCADLEGADYAVRAADICAAGVGAPHIRQRLWWVAYADGGQSRQAGTVQPRRQYGQQPQDGGAGVGLAHRDHAGLEVVGVQHARQERAPAERGGAAGGVGNACVPGREARFAFAIGGPQGSGEPASAGVFRVPGPTNGHWRDPDWLFCRDNRWRPVEPGAFPLAHGIPGRVGRLRAYGNAIVPEVGAEVIRAFMECRP